MLSVNKYSQKYLDDCRSKIDMQLSTYKKLVNTARKQASDKESINAAIGSFELNFFNNLVLALDNLFANRSRALEGKDGNPLNEVRLLCNSIMNNNNRLVADKQIRFDPAKSVVKYKTGDEVCLNEAEFTRLSKAFFYEIEDKYV